MHASLPLDLAVGPAESLKYETGFPTPSLADGQVALPRHFLDAS